MNDQKLTEHFSFYEMTTTTQAELLEANREAALQAVEKLRQVCVELEKLRAFIMRPIIIKSGFRFPPLNSAVGGSTNSQHMAGEAADFSVAGSEHANALRFCFDWCCNHLVYGQIIFESPLHRKPWIHLGLPREGRPRTQLIFDGRTYLHT